MANRRPDDWRQKSAQRLEEARARQPDPYQDAPVAKAAHEGARSLALEVDRRMKRQRESTDVHAGEPVAPEPDEYVSVAALMTSQRQYHRTGSGLRASTYEPQRHTWFVEGRPIQARTASDQRNEF